MKYKCISKSWFYGLFAAVFGVLSITSTHAQTSTINPIADAFVDSANPNSNYGSAGALAIAPANLPNGGFDSVIMFNFASTKASFDALYGVGKWTVQSITLSFNAAFPMNPIFNGYDSGNIAGLFAINWMQNDSWTEGNGNPMKPSTTGGITYSTLPNYLSSADESLGTFSFDGSDSGYATYQLAPARGLTTDVMNGNNSSMELFAADSGVSYVFNSKDSGDADPVLTITAAAAPANIPTLPQWALVSLAASILIMGMRSLRGEIQSKP